MENTTPPEEQERLALSELLEGLPDPRIDIARLYRLVDILTIAIWGALSEVDNLVELERFGRANQRWFETCLDLPNGIPSRDTYGRLLAALDPDAVRAVFVAWMMSRGKEMA